ncbi:MAG: hypothetical protein K2N06_12755 [Oscillospiraceae bacterium]|nr:hypothetical protein [Oscillospiraceae bacterium]
MKKHIGILAVILGISCLCGCGTTFGVGKLDDLTTEPRMEIDYNAVKEGYYLSDSGDGSYYFIKDGKFTLVGYDWEKDFRENNPRSEHSDMTDSEYEENVCEYAEFSAEDYTNKPFTPVRAINYPESYPPIRLVINSSTEEIKAKLQGDSGFAMECIFMKDENTIGREPPFYIYCGTSLPESE